MGTGACGIIGNAARKTEQPKMPVNNCYMNLTPTPLCLPHQVSIGTLTGTVLSARPPAAARGGHESESFVPALFPLIIGREVVRVLGGPKQR